MKDFSSEVRASMDVSHFIRQAQLLLDVDETSVEGVLDRMLKALLDQEPLTSAEEAKNALFVKDSGKLGISGGLSVCIKIKRYRGWGRGCSRRLILAAGESVEVSGATFALGSGLCFGSVNGMQWSVSFSQVRICVVHFTK